MKMFVRPSRCILRCDRVSCGSGFCVSAWSPDRRHLASGANSGKLYAVGVKAQSPESRQRIPGQRFFFFVSTPQVLQRMCDCGRRDATPESLGLG